MSKAMKDLNGLLSRQQVLFDREIVEGALDVSMSFRDSLTKAIRGLSSDSRYIVAAKISELVGRNISKDMLDKYTSSNQDYGIRAEDLTAFCAVTRTIAPFRALLLPIHHDVIGPEESGLLELARMERHIDELQAEAARIRTKMGIRR